MKKLPNKPSRLIYLALEDLEKAEKSPLYKINMWKWHDTNGQCSVCLAGAVIAGSLECSAYENSTPDDYDYDTRDKLQALDSFRLGDVDDGLDEMCINVPEFMADVDGNWREEISLYAVSPERFKEDMLALAGTLDLVGL